MVCDLWLITKFNQASQTSNLKLKKKQTIDYNPHFIFFTIRWTQPQLLQEKMLNTWNHLVLENGCLNRTVDLFDIFFI